MILKCQYNRQNLKYKSNLVFNHQRTIIMLISLEENMNINFRKTIKNKENFHISETNCSTDLDFFFKVTYYNYHSIQSNICNDLLTQKI